MNRLNVDWDGNELLLSDILGTETDEVYGHLEEEVRAENCWDVRWKSSPAESGISWRCASGLRAAGR